MRTKGILLVGLVILVSPAIALAQKDKAPAGLPSGDLFFTMKGQPFALERTFPGITGALLLTEAQRERIQRARAEILQSEEVRTAASTAKSNPNAADARKIIEEARRKMQAEVANTLTKEQKDLIERLNEAAMDAHKAAREKYESDYASAKGNEAEMKAVQEKAQEEARTVFLEKAKGILTKEQLAGLEKAAKEQKAAEAAAKTKKKDK